MEKEVNFKGLKFYVYKNGNIEIGERNYITLGNNQYKKGYKRKIKLKRRKVNFRDNGNGYMSITIHTNNNSVTVYQHRLVAMAYCEKEQNQNYVNHIDFNTKNNHCSNLEWCTAKENMNHSIKHGRMNTITDNDFKKIIKDYKKGLSLRALSKKYNYGSTTIRVKMKENNIPRRRNTCGIDKKGDLYAKKT